MFFAWNLARKSHDFARVLCGLFFFYGILGSIGIRIIGNTIEKGIKTGMATHSLRVICLQAARRRLHLVDVEAQHQWIYLETMVRRRCVYLSRSYRLLIEAELD